MKKLMIPLLSLALITGCGSVQQESVSFSLTEEEISIYKEEVTSALKENGWASNPDSLAYAMGTVPGKEDEAYEPISSASTATGLDPEAYAGDEAVLVSTTLQYINGREGGTAYFIFVNRVPVCEYYVYNGGYYPLSSKNPFENTGMFTAYEDTEVTASYNRESIAPSIEEVYDEAEGIVATISENRAVFYNAQEDYALVSSTDFTSQGLKPMDIALGEDGGFILLGREVKVEESDEAGTCLHNPEKPVPARSVSLVPIDREGRTTGEPVPVEVSSYSSVSLQGDRIILTRDKSIDEFTYEGGSLNKVSSYSTAYNIDKLTICDIDGNGSEEYITSDGSNIYVYSEDSTLELIWRTNLSMSSIEGKVYTGDLNGDGINEIYLTDSSGITARYILTPRGFTIDGGGYVDGAGKYIIGDFDGDGADEYLAVNDEGGSTLFDR